MSEDKSPGHEHRPTDGVDDQSTPQTVDELIAALEDCAFGGRTGARSGAAGAGRDRERPPPQRSATSKTRTNSRWNGSATTCCRWSTVWNARSNPPASTDAPWRGRCHCRRRRTVAEAVRRHARAVEPDPARSRSANRSTRSSHQAVSMVESDTRGTRLGPAGASEGLYLERTTGSSRHGDRGQKPGRIR